MHFENFDNSHNCFLWPEYFIDFLCERWIPCQAVTSVLCLHYRPETVHCRTKDAYTSEITFVALVYIILRSYIFKVSASNLHISIYQYRISLYLHHVSIYQYRISLYLHHVSCLAKKFELADFYHRFPDFMCFLENYF